ncbi:hypothetical protein AVEN_100560-1 [Araneus ventricosus]|uniref:Uncharacterized protein n=1 Tax=Araneus ventricosus TaxID=182803 RepID=A0A4Y2FHV2_ARAVE|nr:hypothetical protein AVEN_100560-1 [Araneus ventricosus]
MNAGHEYCKLQEQRQALYCKGSMIAYVPCLQSPSQRSGQKGQIHPVDGHCGRRRLSLQVPQQQVGGGRQGRPRDAQEDVHTPGLTLHGGTVDAKGGLFP